jgi:hypothetical protein
MLASVPQLLDTSLVGCLGLYFTWKGFRPVRNVAEKNRSKDWRIPFFKVLGPVLLGVCVIFLATWLFDLPPNGMSWTKKS